jgi:hypothetical protein
MLPMRSALTQARACGASTYQHAHMQHLQGGGQSPISISVHAFKLAHRQYLPTSGRCNHQVFDHACCLRAQLSLAWCFWCFTKHYAHKQHLRGGGQSPSIISLHALPLISCRAVPPSSHSTPGHVITHMLLTCITCSATAGSQQVKLILCAACAYC